MTEQPFERALARALGEEDARELRLRLLEPSVSLERVWHELNTARLGGRAAATTVDALVFSLRAGVGALSHRDTLHSLSQLSDAQFRDVVVRLQKFPPHIAPAWKTNSLEVLLAVRNRVLHAKNP
jgi:hypothetical protein